MTNDFAVLGWMANSFDRLSKESWSRVTSLANEVGRPPTVVYHILAEEAIRRFLRSSAPVGRDEHIDAMARVKLVDHILHDLFTESGAFTEFERQFFVGVLALNERPSKTLMRPVELKESVLTRVQEVLSKSHTTDDEARRAVESVLWREVQARLERIAPYVTRRGYSAQSIVAFDKFRQLVRDQRLLFAQNPPFQVEELTYLVLMTQEHYVQYLEWRNEQPETVGRDLRFVTLDGTPPPPVRDGGVPLNIFRRTGDFWTLRYQGGEQFQVRHVKGLTYICVLLRHQGEKLHVTELLDIAGDETHSDENRPQTRDLDRTEAEEDGLREILRESGVELVDKASIRSYHQRLHELDETIDDAERDNDLAQLELARQEKSRLLEHLRAVTNTRGRARTILDPVNRERTRVSNAISRALTDSILVYYEPLYVHLQNTIKKGRNLVYKPDTVINWET